MRLHRTTGEQPQTRFHAEAKHRLQPLAPRPYRSLLLLPSEPTAPVVHRAAHVGVERRPLQTYAQLTGDAA